MIMVEYPCINDFGMKAIEKTSCVIFHLGIKRRLTSGGIRSVVFRIHMSYFIELGVILTAIFIVNIISSIWD